jgi:hypothetical protein
MSHVESAVAAGRKASRVRLVVPCEIQGSKETIKVPVRDISLDGIRLVSSESHAVGDTLKVTLRVPARIELSAEIRWVEHEAARSQYVLGCRFVHAGESRQTLKDMLQNMASSIDSAARRVR